MTQDIDVAKWLDKRFLDWQYEQGGSRTLTEFADYLGLSKAALSNYMNGTRRPSEKSALLIGSKLGWEIFDLLGLQRPDPILQEITSIWDLITDEQQQELAHLATKMASENQSKRK